MNWIRLAAAVLITATVASSAPVAGNPLERMIEQVQTEKLSNGLTVLMLEDHDAPVVTVNVWVKTGSRNERPGITGISHLFEHMMFRGSVKYGSEEHARLVKRYGGDCNAFTSEDVTVYYEELPSDQLELGIHLEAERFANLRIDSTTLAEERKVVSEERRQRVDNDVFGSASEQLNLNFYHSSSYSWPVIGWMSDIMGYQVSEVEEYYRLRYAPNNLVLVMVGDFNAKKAMEMVNKYWGKIPAQPTPPQPRMEEVEQRGERRAVFKRQAELPMLFAAFPIPSLEHEDIPALGVLGIILSGGQSSRLYQRLVYKDQLARYAGGSPDTRMGPGMFDFYLGVKQGVSLDSAEKVMWNEVERLRTEPVTEAELVKARNQIESSQVMRLANASSRAMMLGRAQTNYGDYRKATQRLQLAEKVTAEDVMRVAKKYLDPDKRTVLTLIPTKDATADAEAGAR